MAMNRTKVRRIFPFLHRFPPLDHTWAKPLVSSWNLYFQMPV